MKFKSFLLFFLVLALSTLGFAQTTYSTPAFDITFTVNSTVTVGGPVDNTTSTSMDYSAENTEEMELVQVRNITNGGHIAVDYTSSDFYANQALTAFQEKYPGATVVNTSRNEYYGHPFTYLNVELTNDSGQKFWIRTRYIIVSSTEAIFVTRISAPESDNLEWQAFENSLVIK